jgi:PAS domain S-box-containing protein
VVPVLAWAVVTGLVAAVALWAEQNNRDGLRERSDVRSAVGAQFMAAQAVDLAARERAMAVQYLSDRTVSEVSFDRAVTALGFDAAVLLDRRGRLLRVAPASPSRLGADMTSYPHLRQALETGRPAVSPVVPSAARGVRVVGFAVPYETDHGRRVFSGAVHVQSSALGQYLATVSAIPGAQEYLVDSSGTIAAVGDPALLRTGTLAQAAPWLARAVRDGTGEATVTGESTGGTGTPGPSATTGVQVTPGPSSTAGGSVPPPAGSGPGESVGESVRSAEPAPPVREGTRFHVFTAPVAGTPWTLVVATPEEVLYANAIQARRLLVPAFVVLALLGLAAALAVVRSRRHRAALAEADARFRSVFDSHLVGMLLTTPQGQLHDVNDAFCAMLGYARDELTDSMWVDLTHPQDRGESLRRAKRMLDGTAEGMSFDKRYLRRDGTALHATVSTSLIRSHDGQPLYFATLVIDVTARRALELEREAAAKDLADRGRQLQAANAALEQANTAVADLVAMLSHDLRQPLSVVTGFTDLCLDSWDDLDEQTRIAHLHRIGDAGHRLQTMLEETLTVSALDAGGVTTNPAPVRVDEVVVQTLAGMGEAPAGLDLSGLCTATAHVDRGHLVQVLTNLIGNAVKYGHPPLSISCDQTPDAVLLRVSDSGDGVPVDFAPHLFDRYARADRDRRSDTRGTGLGLYIARSLLRANGADIWHEPTPGGGATFTVRLPLAAAVPPPPRTPQTTTI